MADSGVPVVPLRFCVRCGAQAMPGESEVFCAACWNEEYPVEPATRRTK